jgi:hypothetical protein
MESASCALRGQVSTSGHGSFSMSDDGRLNNPRLQQYSEPSGTLD